MKINYEAESLIKLMPANVNIDSDCLLNERVTEEGLWNLHSDCQ